MAARDMQDIVVKAILVVPNAYPIRTEIIHRADNVEKVLPEFVGNIFVNRIYEGQLESDHQEVEAVHCHPTGGIGLLNVSAVGQLRAAIEGADVIEP